MRVAPPELGDGALVETVEAGWGVDSESLDYEPVGFGSHHWTLRTGGERWFLTVDDLDAKLRSRSDDRRAARARLRAALMTARDLANSGLAFVIAPIPAVGGEVLVAVDDRFSASLYPYVEGTPGAWDDVPDVAARLEVLKLVEAVHHAMSDHAGIDDLEIAMLDELYVAIDGLGEPWDAGPFAEPARRLLDEHARPLLRLLDSYDRLAVAVRAASDRFVLTHGEQHPGNTIATPTGLVLIDWDTALIAPPERDLWTVAGDDRRVVEAYTESTGRHVLDAAMTCYRLAWDLNEIALYIALLRDEHTGTADVAESWHNLQYFLQPETRWSGLIGAAT